MFNVVYSENKTVTSETPVKDSYRSKMKIIHALTSRKNKQLTPNMGGEKACMLKSALVPVRSYLVAVDMRKYSTDCHLTLGVRER